MGCFDEKKFLIPVFNNIPLKIFFLPLWLWALLTAAAVYSQPVKVSVVSTQLNAPADISVTLSTKNLGLAPIYSLFTDSASGCQPGACAALPLTLLSFEGKRLNVNQVVLTWKTANEVNTAGFDVQRSLGNQTQFEKIAFVPALPGGARVSRNVPRGAA